MANLTDPQILNIETASKDVLQSVFVDIENISLPVDVSKILEKYEFKVKEGKFPDPDLAGMYDRDSNTILVSEDDPYPRKIFTIAHELGHYFLHKDKSRERFFRTQITQLDSERVKEEAEANWFAASLLMPEHLVRKYWELTHDMEKIATIFSVSHSAVYFRLKNLKLLQ